MTRYRDCLRLGAALQIGFPKMCGRPLDAVQRVPADLLKHLGQQLEIPADHRDRPHHDVEPIEDRLSDFAEIPLRLAHRFPAV